MTIYLRCDRHAPEGLRPSDVVLTVAECVVCLTSGEVLRDGPGPSDTHGFRPSTVWTPEALIRLRKAARLNQTELARRLGVSRITVWRWEHRGIVPTHQTTLKLLKRLEIETAQLVTPIKA